MRNFLHYLRLILGITALVFVGIICITTILWVNDVGIPKVSKIVGWDRWERAKYINEYNTQIEEQSAKQEDNSVIGWVMDCMGAKEEVRNIPYNIRKLYPKTDTPNVSPRTLFLPEKSILTLNNSLLWQRIVLKLKADSAYELWQITSITTILLGMATTILVSLSATEFGRGDGRTQKLIRILAMIFPVLGTAAAGVIAFYGPQAEWTQASRTLASVTQLHGQMAVGIWKLKCIQKEDDENAKAAAAALDEWSKRYVDIQTISTATGSTTGGTTTQQKQQQQQ